MNLPYLRTSRVSLGLLPCPDSQPFFSSFQKGATKASPFLPGASLVKLGANECWMVFKAPYCTEEPAIESGKPAMSPQQHAESTGIILSLYHPKLRFTGPGCWLGESRC